MYVNDKKNFNCERNIAVLKKRLKLGMKKIFENPHLLIASAIYWLVAVYCVFQYEPSNVIQRVGWLFGMPLSLLAALVVFVAGVIFSAIPKNALTISHNLQRAGLCNSAAEPPVLLSTSSHENGRKTLTLWNCGIGKAQYTDTIDRIESALNCRVIEISDGLERDTICLHLAPGNTNIPDRVDWNDQYLSEDESVFCLGISLEGIYRVCLNSTPHLIVAGSTGSGKTVLIKTIVHQALKRNSEVYLIDMKGGVDYPLCWKNGDCSYDDDPLAALSTLSHIIEELEQRKTLFSMASCANIAEYNSRNSATLHHILVVLDEIAELTDTTGLDKEHKEIVYRTIAHLSTIARMGRAYGIHLIVGTQRPDANILPGQIKNNCDIRICGRADNTLSMIILDNTDAANRISKGSHGRFLTNDGTEFQGFWLA